MKVVYGLIKDIKGYRIHIHSHSKSAIKKCYDGYVVSLVIVALVTLFWWTTQFSHLE